MAWDGTTAVGVSRPMRQTGGTLQPAADGHDVEVVWVRDGSPAREIVRVLPPAPDPKDSDTAVIGWEASHSESGTQRNGAVPRLGDVPTEGFAGLGTLVTDYDGGAQVTILRDPAPAPLGQAAPQPVFTGLWVWTTPAAAPGGDHPLLPRLTSALASALRLPAA